MTYRFASPTLGNYEFELFPCAAYHISATYKREQLVRGIYRSHCWPEGPEAPFGPRKDEKTTKMREEQGQRERRQPAKEIAPGSRQSDHFC